jgi:hypothetical protein
MKATYSFLVPIIISFAFLFTIIVTIGNIVAEKQSKMKEYLKLVGIKWYVIWLTWFLRSIVIYTIISVLISSIGLIPIPASQYTNSTRSYVARQLFTFTNFGITLLTLFIYSIQTSAFTILMSQIFSKRNVFFFNKR